MIWQETFQLIAGKKQVRNTSPYSWYQIQTSNGFITIKPFGQPPLSGLLRGNGHEVRGLKKSNGAFEITSTLTETVTVFFSDSGEKLEAYIPKINGDSIQTPMNSPGIQLFLIDFVMGQKQIIGPTASQTWEDVTFDITQRADFPGTVHVEVGVAAEGLSTALYTDDLSAGQHLTGGPWMLSGFLDGSGSPQSMYILITNPSGENGALGVVFANVKNYS
jgi:hypothetical protein